MPLDTLTTYSQTLLRQDGRRWNELRRITASISTQPSSDGSSLLTMGNTMVLCTVTGPREGRGQRDNNNAIIETEINIAPFAQMDRRRRNRNDKRTQELQTTISNAFQSHLFTHLYPRSTISITLHVLSLDGALLVACLNAASLALVDAGVPMPSILAAISSGSITPTDDSSAKPEPILDLNNAEEQELPFLSIATVSGQQGMEDRVSVLMMETRCQIGGANSKMESMLATGVDGCQQVRRKMEDVIRKHGAKIMQTRK
ncbi:Exosome non-catalytic core component [Elasticomyces elasticus]|uniref:Exosome non-catalytic core component n=1 Tax=Exophiala sideris TaxID=1016849 RepID=A0ABR0IZ25_9EURO|nr:Exosome non-catalytic core component [Elasticomyces elasticus]KAK5023018.1 Exosome non-catalytic core component [Exophiala sideris]KAK5026743.1 Exosome non-catalytic core component [Exophiala sideris]KAK5052396.1 Exosome non-catalytic core component [Exophiala sideris]KAK5178181.1 Exosome non-catalytic core component [Eurotiomycetes sp. CCFEE 6388]